MSYNLTTMQSIYHNQDEIVEITYNGSTVYQKSSGPDYTEPFYVENISNENETLSIKKNSSAPTLTIEYSTDKTKWRALGVTSDTALTRTLAPGDKVYLRCKTNTWGEDYAYATNMIFGVSKVGGNIMSLLYGSNFTGEETSFPSGSTRNFYYLFRNNTTLVDASKLLLPATTLATSCYYGMFDGCTSLTQAPALPATTLTDYCYSSMFQGCTSLTQAPALPATTLTDYCYSSMFQGCTSLTTAPVLPATTLATSCYWRMFQGCTSLTQAPVLPATTLATSCYSSMFLGCTSLTTAPALPATTLATSCYDSMFYRCTSLTIAPALPATTLATSCYDSMFQRCTLLSNVTCLATSGIDQSSTSQWLANVSSTGTFTKAAGVEWPTGVNGIPSGWTVIEV